MNICLDSLLAPRFLSYSVMLGGLLLLGATPDKPNRAESGPNQAEREAQREPDDPATPNRDQSQGDKPARAKTIRAADAQQAKHGDGVAPKFEIIAAAGAMVDMPLRTQDGQVIGKISDLLIDLEAGQVSLLVVSPLTQAAVGQRGDMLVLPSVTIECTDQRFCLREGITHQMLTNTRRFDVGVIATMNRRLASEQYEAFGSELYPIALPDAAAGAKQPNGDAQPEGEANRDGRPDRRKKDGQQDVQRNQAELEDAVDQAYRLTMFTALKDVKIVDKRNQEVGRIVDFAIEPNTGRVAYAAVSLKDSEGDELHPIPLGAFVLREDSDAWLVELPAAGLERSPSFPRNAWPKQLDRGWVEYSHVRYGRSALGGVQTVKKGARNAEKIEAQRQRESQE